MADINQLKYKQKYRRLKSRIKSLVFENAALCDQVALIQENVLIVKEERRFLLKKLIEHEHDLEELAVYSTKKIPIAKKKLVDGNGKKIPTGKKLKLQQHQPQPTSQKVVEAITFDANNHPIYPIRIGMSEFTVYNLGRIVFEKPAFHTETVIYPVNYTITRMYANLKNPDKKCTYTCRIVENGNFPRFEVIPDSDMTSMISGPSTDYCHSIILQSINKSTNIRKVVAETSKGDQFFGIDHPIICSLLQNFPNASKCTNFKGLKVENYNMDKDNDPSLSFDALQRYRSNELHQISYRAIPEIKEEPPDELFQ